MEELRLQGENSVSDKTQGSIKGKN